MVRWLRLVLALVAALLVFALAWRGLWTPDPDEAPDDPTVNWQVVHARGGVPEQVTRRPE